MDYCPKVYVYVQLSAMYTVAEVESNVLHLLAFRGGK